MSEKANIDEAIREKLENFSVEPPTHLWGEISGDLAAMKKHKRMAAIGWMAAAAVVVFAFLAGWLVNDRSKTIVPEMAEQKKVQEKTENQSETQPQSKETEIRYHEAEVIAESNDQPKSTESKIQNAVARTLVASNPENSNERVPLTSSSESRNERSMEYLPFRKAELTRKTENTIGLKTTMKHTPVSTISQSDQSMMASNISNLKKENKPEHDWIVGAYLSPGYSDHTSSYTATYSSNMNTRSEGGVSNMGGGISVQYKTGKKLRIESGVYYAQNNQSRGTSNSLFSMAPAYDNLSGGMEYASNDRVSANIVELKPGGMAMNSTAGVVKIVHTPKGSELSANSSGDFAMNSATLITSGEFLQQFDFIEIPMYLRYRLIDKKLGVDLMGGLNAGLVVGNNVYVSNEFGKQNVGTTEDISTLNLSGTLGFGLNYALGTHFSLSMEPRLNYYLNSINTNPDVSYKPYRFGLFTGVYYAF